MPDIDYFIGQDGNAITWWQMSLRALIVMFFLIALLRVGEIRIFGKWTPVDIVMSVLLGSTLSRAVSGNAPLFATLTASIVLVFLHWAITRAAVESPTFHRLLKGKEIPLIENGKLIEKNMRKAALTQDELRQALRREGKKDDLAKVKEAHLEANGKISIILSESSS